MDKLRKKAGPWQVKQNYNQVGQLASRTISAQMEIQDRRNKGGTKLQELQYRYTFSYWIMSICCLRAIRK